MHIFVLFQNVTPHVYSSSIAQCTLPRHTSQHLWPNYNNVLTGVRHTQPISSIHQKSSTTLSNINQVPIYSDNISSATSSNVIQSVNSSSIPSNNFQPGNQQIQRTRICVGMGNSGIHTMEPVCLSDEEVTAQTPLMMKRESTV